VLRTNTDLNPLEAMLCYKQLWTVEQTFRTANLSTSAFLTHSLSVCGVQPILATIDTIAAHRDVCSAS